MVLDLYDIALIFHSTFNLPCPKLCLKGSETINNGFYNKSFLREKKKTLPKIGNSF